MPPKDIPIARFLGVRVIAVGKSAITAHVVDVWRRPLLGVTEIVAVQLHDGPTINPLAPAQSDDLPRVAWRCYLKTGGISDRFAAVAVSGVICWSSLPGIVDPLDPDRVQEFVIWGRKDGHIHTDLAFRMGLADESRRIGDLFNQIDSIEGSPSFNPDEDSMAVVHLEALRRRLSTLEKAVCLKRPSFLP